MEFPLHNVTIVVRTVQRSAWFKVEVPNWGGVKIHFVKRKSNCDGPWRLFHKRRDSIPKVKGFQYKLKSGLDEI